MKTILFVLILGVIFYFVIDEMRKKNVPMPTQLHPIVAEKRDQLIQRAAQKGITIVITDDFRSAEEQDELYARGRTEEGTVVTHVEGGESYHNYGLAIDFALQLKDGTVVWDLKRDDNKNGKSDWMEVVAIAKEQGFSWGGDWYGFKDYPHLEMDFGLSIRELQYGERPPVR
ncbi:M15 family metallopeptidase [Fictibacillus nanhaiensis]|uniref:M15 family metallopeptidase n=1 Tax=Fictibacillus nanhaiensis TaxID=742169 RepID=UPI001C97E042|nr:M15 family metallopeptidase [Fictibacillus nanhaiensis]MBY6038164.1 M15 family metallopeptidase [Fictibacillus nanhaiensis]